ncbi:MAG: DUF1800 domain-containing protein [Candidatus Obscuribacterales bacterium]
MRLKALLCLIVFIASSAPAFAGDTANRDLARHVLNRLAYGPRPGDIDRVAAMGVDAYINQQLDPDRIPLPEPLQSLIERSPALTLTPAQLFLKYRIAPNGKRSGQKADARTIAEREELQKKIRQNFQQMYGQITDARLMRAVYSPRQLEEVMTEFWFNHFNISFDKGLDHLWTGAYEQTAIRPHALGKFRDLLESTSHHAAMQFYLDNWQNTGDGARKRGRFAGINENYARELMELHTLGVDGGYSQADVIALARILTGHGMQNRQSVRRTGIGVESPTGYFFDASRHDNSDKLFLGRTINGQGERELQEALDILAAHPSTAHFVSYKLVQYFVSDEPDKKLVDSVAATYKRSGGDIKAMLRVIFKSSQFLDKSNDGAKFKTPYRYLISSLRATNATIVNTKPLLGFLRMQGMPLYRCLTPDGYKYTEKAWLNPGGLLQRIDFASALGSGHFRAARPRELEAGTIADIVGVQSGSTTMSTVDGAPPALSVALLLGSPEFMKY